MIKRIVKEVQLAAESCDGTLDKGNFWLIASIGHDLPGHKIIQAIKHRARIFYKFSEGPRMEGFIDGGYPYSGVIFFVLRTLSRP